ncbi:MAG TPA: hypothetical protein VGO25_10600, partial [Rhodanobacteraceae bacterium]|nr:hypothetical protein [Rhodanobacteraceae bacterium]
MRNLLIDLRNAIPAARRNRARFQFVLAFITLPFSFAAKAQSAPATTDNAAQLPTVVVTGEQPGPGLWKVTSGDHVLWILGTLSPLPKKMTWRSGEVEAIVARS